MITQKELNSRIYKAQGDAQISNTRMSQLLGMHRCTYAGKLLGKHPWTWTEIEKLNEIFGQDLTKEGRTVEQLVDEFMEHAARYCTRIVLPDGETIHTDVDYALAGIDAFSRWIRKGAPSWPED